MADTDVVTAEESRVDSTIGDLANLSNAPDDALLVVEYLGKAYNSTLGQLKAALGAITGFAKTAGDSTPGTNDVYTITFANGGKLDITIPIPKDGEDGEDGYTPKKGVDYEDGKDGYTPVKGEDYFDGTDGVSPTVATKAVADGVQVTITDKDGPHSFVLPNGKDGVSPTVTVHVIEGGYRVTFSDGVTSDSVDLYNGNSGDWTANSPEVVGYIRGRTHWVDSVWDELFNVSGISGGSLYKHTEAIGLTEGKQYLAFHNGVQYICNAVAYNDGTYTGVQLQNAESGAELPFSLIEFSAESAASIGWNSSIIAGMDGSATVTLVIVYTEIVYHKLDNRFLDLEWMAAHKDSGTEIIPETTITAATTMSYSRDLLVNGAEYIITWNGEKYRRRCAGSAYGARLGNSSLWNSNDEDNGDPFLFLGIGTIRVIATEYPATFSVERIYYDPLPYDYAPKKYTIPTEIGTTENGRCTVPNSEMFQAALALESGAKVYGMIGYSTVEILALYIDMDEYCHGFVYRNYKGDLFFTRCSNNEYTKVDAMTPAVDRDDIILRNTTDGVTTKWKVTVDASGNLTTTAV